jgi:thioredoxin reductase (NADPH)
MVIWQKRRASMRYVISRMISVFVVSFSFLAHTVFGEENGQDQQGSVYPVIILGSGMGALSASLYLARAGIIPLVIEGPVRGGAITQATIVSNWPGEKSITGSSLAEKFRKQVDEYHVAFMQDKVTKVDFSKRPFVVCTESVVSKEEHCFLADSCIIAMGSSPRKLQIAGEDTYSGKGVSYCVFCDGALFKGQNIAVIGGGNAAISETMYLSSLAKKIYLLMRKEDFTSSDEIAKKKILSLSNVDVIPLSDVKEIQGDGEQVKKVVFENIDQKEKRSLDVEGVFVAIGSVPNSQIFQTQLLLDAGGYICVDDERKTSQEGVYAIGDIVRPYVKQAILATADGVVAAEGVQGYLRKVSPNKLHKASIKKAAFSLSEGEFSIMEIQREEQFDEQLKSKNTLLIDFYASWCGPCKRLAPILEEKAKKLSGKIKVLKVNVDRFPQLAQRYQIRSMPTMIMINSHGKVTAKKIGSEEILALVEELTKKSL